MKNLFFIRYLWRALPVTIIILTLILSSKKEIETEHGKKNYNLHLYYILM